MPKAGISREELAEKLNYSYRNMCRILEGKLMLPPELLHYEAEKVVPDLQYVNEFSDANNLDQILGLMDKYIDLKEVM